MNALVCGLNTYLGKTILTSLQSENLHVYGIIRDASLLEARDANPINAKLFNVDIIRLSSLTFPIPLPQIDVSFYFTQIPDLADEIGIQYELLSLKNFIQLSKNNNCTRIVYFGRVYDKNNIIYIQQLFEKEGIRYTIVLKDVAIGNGSAFDRFMQQMMTNKLIFLYKPIEKVILRPVCLSDFIQWVKQVDWQHDFINEYLEFGAQQAVEIEELMQLYLSKYSSPQKHKIITIPYECLAKLLNRIVSKVSYDHYADYINTMSKRTLTDNSKWTNLIPFQYSKIETAV